ncbi:MAG: DUF5110 domain-containing protein, partial [Flavobacteriaceae bacterium]|nr:DUF5110 domain-containing protein [Flavobacteriaceae bacterium]
YTRWLQYGVFQPIFRPHAQEQVPSEPVFREERTMELAKKAIEMRYKLLPYNYNLAFQNNQYGTPLMRPLFFEDDSKEFYVHDDTYLWGDDFLVTPIVNPGETEKEVYFPKNNVWIDLYANEKIAGGQSKKIKVSEEYIPTFVKAGAFIPFANLVQSTDQYALREFELFYFFDKSITESKGEFYNDDGLTKEAYEKEHYEILKFKANFQNRTLQLNLGSEIGDNFNSELKSITVRIPNIDQVPKYIKVDGKRIRNSNLSTDKTLSIPVKWDTSKTMNIKIKFKK